MLQVAFSMGNGSDNQLTPEPEVLGLGLTMYQAKLTINSRAYVGL